MSLKQKILDLIHEIFTDIDHAIEPGVEYLKTHVPAEAIKLAETVVEGAVAGTPWGNLVTVLMDQAKTAGIALAEQAADAALNSAKINLIASGNTSGNAASTPAAPAAEGQVAS